MKKIISALLVLIMLVSVVPTTVFAEESDISSATDETNVEIESDGGLGGLITNSLEEQKEAEVEEDVDIENKILEVEVEGNVATVAFNNAAECNIIVAIYDEATNVMVGSGMGSYAENTETAEIEIDIETMPEYFVVKAYLLDVKNNPLHTSYESIEYTKAHQEFLATTVDDFEEGSVINFDEDKTNNFAVLKATTIYIESNGYENVILSVDEDTKTYVFASADEALLNLSINDSFYYCSNDVCISGVVENITIHDNTVTVIGNADAALDDVFAWVKIDTSSTGTGATVDMSNSSEGFEYLGEYSPPVVYGILGDHDITVSSSHKWGISRDLYSSGADTDNSFSVKLKGELEFKVQVQFKAHIYFDYCSVELSVSEETAFEISLEGKIEANAFDVAEIDIPTGIGDIKIALDLDFVIECSAAITFSATEKSTVGMRFDTRVGRLEDISVPSKVETEKKFEGKLFAGIKAQPKVKAFGDIVEVNLSLTAGLEIKAETVDVIDTESVKHTCISCVDGEISFVFSVGAGYSIKVKILEKDIFDYSDEVELCSVKKKVMDIYCTNGIWNVGNCSNYFYRAKYYVVDSNRNPISGASVGDVTTDSNGVADVFYVKGDFETSVSKLGYRSYNHCGSVDTPCDFVITLYKDGETTNNTWDSSGLGNVIYKGNNDGTTKVYFYDDNGWGSSANVYAYTYKYLPAAGVDEALGVWPGISCDYEGANIWSVDMPNACTHIIFSYSGNTDTEDQTNDIPNPGKTMIAVRGTGYEYNDVMGYHPIYEWEEYDVSTASVSLMAIDDETEITDETENIEVATFDEATPVEPTPVIVEESITVNDLVPGGMYAFTMLKGGIENYTVDTETLVYITDGVADENGSIELTYYYEDFEGQWLGVIFGPCNHSISDWKIINEQTLTETGFKAKFCTKCFEVIDTEEIPANQIREISLYDAPALVTGDEDAINDITLCVSLDSGEYLYVSGLDCTLEGYDSTLAGEQTVTVTYYGFKDSVTVNVLDRNEIYKDIYFINIQDWESVCAYYSGSAYNTVNWPGVAMTYVETNSYGQDVYACSVPKDITILKFNDSTEIVRTDDIAITAELTDDMGWYPTSQSTGGCWNVDAFTYVSGDDNIPENFEEEIGTYTIYFENYNVWTRVYAYVWIDSGELVLGQWPGTPCTHIGNNIWSIEVPADCTNIIFSSGSSGTQTNDLIIPGDNYIYQDMSYWTEYVPITSEGGMVESNILLMGSFNEWKGQKMYYTDDTTCVSTIVELESGTYTFKVYIPSTGKWLSNSGTITDTTETSSSGWSVSTLVSSNCSLSASGGTYTFVYDTSTNRIKVLYTPVATEPPTEVPELPSVDLAFSGASLTLQDNLCINFKANENLFTEVGYENPYVIFELNGEEYTVTDYEVVSGKYVFDFSDISPANMNDTVKATLYATFDGVEYASETREYSVATYCYNMLSKYNTDDYVELRTLLVDLLNYGAQTQIYTNYNTDALVNAQLTEEQAAWGTSETPAYETVQNLEYETIENPTVQWKGGGLNLQDSVTMRFKISAESIENLTVIAETDTTIWTISAEEFEATTGGYYVFFDGLDASQMSEAVYLTVYDGDMPVSNTICYSIESYAYSKQSSTDTNLVNLLEAMMKYGNSASAYVN